MGAIASQITSLTIVYSIVYSDADQRKHQSSASLAFVRGIHRGPVNSPHKWPVTRKMFPFDDVIMLLPVAIWIRCLAHVFPAPGALARAVLGKVPSWKNCSSGGHLLSDFDAGIRNWRMKSSRRWRWGLTVSFILAKVSHCTSRFRTRFVTRISSIELSSDSFLDK